MTERELEAALRGMADEIDTFQEAALGRLADVAADMGDVTLEAGYRYMAGRGMWPTKLRMDDESPDDRTRRLIDPQPWFWMGPEDETTVRYSCEMSRFRWIPNARFGTCHGALEAAARLIGDWLFAQRTAAAKKKQEEHHSASLGERQLRGERPGRRRRRDQ